MIEDKAERKLRLKLIMNNFETVYPDADCTLEYVDPWRLLVAAILAAQCTDKRVNMVTPTLFLRYPAIKDFAEADEEELCGYVRSTGLYRNKARGIIGAAHMILEDFNGEVPHTVDKLVRLPGVGRKIANLIVGDAFGQPAIVIDTHAGRLLFRMGFASGKNPVKTESELREIIPPDRGARFCHQLVEHGRKICSARKPLCQKCSVIEYCEKNIQGKYDE